LNRHLCSKRPLNVLWFMSISSSAF